MQQLYKVQHICQYLQRKNGLKCEGCKNYFKKKSLSKMLAVVSKSPFMFDRSGFFGAAGAAYIER